MPADWQNFAVVTGGASGALTGLLFVAVSLRGVYQRRAERVEFLAAPARSGKT
jgi:hypothetical protein